MAHIKSHLGCSNSPWRNKKTTWSTGLSSPNFMSAPEKSTSNTKYIHHLHPFTTIFIYILLKKKISAMQLPKMENTWKCETHTLYQNTTALARERHSNCAELSPKTQHHRHRPEQLELHRILVFQGPSLSAILLDQTKGNAAKPCSKMTQRNHWIPKHSTST